MLKMMSIVVLAVGASFGTQAAAGRSLNGTERSGLVLPPVSGSAVYRAGGGGTGCPTWRCGLNGTGRSGLVSLPAAPQAQQPVAARPTTTGDAFIATGVTLVNGAFIRLD